MCTDFLIALPNNVVVAGRSMEFGRETKTTVSPLSPPPPFPSPSLATLPPTSLPLSSPPLSPSILGGLPG